MRTVDRRRFERFAVAPMYTPVSVRLLADSTYDFDGHAYDVGEGGLRLELDRPIDPGTPIAIQVTLPGEGERAVFAFANIVWVQEDEAEPGPVRMGAAFTRFARSQDKDRLLMQLASGRFARAA